MSDEDIDLERVVTDPQYRREVIDFLNSGKVPPAEEELTTLQRRAETVN